jgi:hypothetical protein
MSGRSSYQLRNTNISRTPIRYQEYQMEHETEPVRRA